MRILSWRSIAIAGALLLSILLSCANPSGAQQSDSEARARQWVQRLSATMQEHASQNDVDHLLEIYADDAVYEHPHAKARIEGKAVMRKGISSHLGETRNPNLQIVQILSGAGFAVVEFKLGMDISDDQRWVPMSRRQVVVLEFDGTQIKRVIDHWDH